MKCLTDNCEAVPPALPPTPVPVTVSFFAPSQKNKLLHESDVDLSPNMRPQNDGIVTELLDLTRDAAGRGFVQASPHDCLQKTKHPHT